MIDANAFSNLKKTIDNTIKVLEFISVPRYMWMEIQHPKKKKPRGSIRRKRKEE